LLSGCALEYANKNVKEKGEGLELNEIYQISMAGADIRISLSQN
jgi:hypothetical protein